MTDNYDVALAALLYDIDKVAERAQIPIENKLLKSANILLEDDFTEKIVLEASQLSFGIDNKKNSISNKDENLRLYSIFQNINIGKSYDRKEYYHRLVPLSISDSVFPIEKEQLKNQDPVEEYATLIRKMEKDLERELGEYETIKDIKEKDKAYNKIYYILERYTTFIPYSPEKYSDISLFEHLKATSAIATCINEYCKNGKEDEEDKFILLAGDVSGIQNFIYQVTEGEETKENVSKNLRGKSFYINTFIDFMSKYIVKELNLNISNILYCGGGAFQILIPNTSEAIKKLGEIELKIQKYLYDKYRTRLGLVLAHIEIDEEGIKNYADSLAKIQDKLVNAKNQKFLNIINLEKDDFFLRHDDIKKTCIYCHEHEGILEGKMCKECSTHIELGEKLVKNRLKYIVYDFEGEIEKCDVKVNFGSMGQVCFYSKLENKDIGFMVENINDTGEFGRTKFVGNTVPLNNNVVASFNDIAPLAEGDKKIAVLKMDIDNLGTVFSTGFEGENTSIARTSTLSRMIDLFFCGYINKICEDLYEEYLEVQNASKINLENFFYINFSGGDDLVIVGPWDWTIRLAMEIKNRLNEYVCQNPNITISGGIYMANSTVPVRITLYESEKYLEKAKDRKGKDALCLFGKDFSWQYGKYNVKKLVEDGREYADWINNKYISRGLVYNIMIASENIKRKGEIDFDLIPQLAYSISRNIKNEQIKNILIKRLITPHIEDSEIEFIRYPLMIALMKTRE